MDFSDATDLRTEAAAAPTMIRRDQDSRRHGNRERLEGGENENEKGRAGKMDRGQEENRDRLSAASASAVSTVGSNPTQLAIFFDGAIYVYDAVSVEKAQAIMLIAAATAAAAKTTMPVQSSTLSHAAVAAAGISPQSEEQQPENMTSSLCRLQAELPITRRNSLQRFLEKRRARLMNGAPYVSKKWVENPGSPTGSEVSTPSEDF